MQWDGSPYVPVGTWFVPRSFSSADAAAWAADRTELDALKSRSITDIIVCPAGSLADVPAAAIQRLTAYLDGNQFRYGIAFGSGLTAPISGTVVKPSTYRFMDTRDSLTAEWPAEHTDNALFLLVDTTNDNHIVRRMLTGPPRDGAITAPIEAPSDSGTTVALLFPHKTLPAAGHGTIPDIWTGFDAYRDALLALFGQIKLGRGFRFFLDPLGRHIGFLGEADYLIPDSAAFRLVWEAFLMRRYPRLEDARQAWGLTEGDFKTHAELARLIPLWANERGVPYLYDGTNTYRVLDVRQSRWWRDFLECRSNEVLYSMDAIADVLKQDVADVPVVYTWTQMHSIFFNVNTAGGFDGLAVAPNPADPDALSHTVCPAYSEVRQAAKTLWFPATEIGGGAAPATGASRPIGVPSVRLTTLSGAAQGPLALFDELREAGVKGFFAGASGQGATAGQPSVLDALGLFAQGARDAASISDHSPRILFYPESAPGPAQLGPVPGAPGTLWLPSFQPGAELDWWPAYTGYVLGQATDPHSITVLESLTGRRVTHLAVANAKAVQVFAPDGARIPAKLDGPSGLVVTLDTTPTVFRTDGQPVVPREAADDAIVELTAMIRTATAAKMPGADAMTGPLERAQSAYRARNYDEAYTFARSTLDDVLYLAAPYMWLEGELPKVQTFTDIAPNPQASSGAYLRLSTTFPPSRFGYAARYLFDVQRDGHYNIWLAGTVPGPQTSPIKWRINSEPEQPVADPSPHGPLYLDRRFGWILLGTADLTRGIGQSLTIYVTDRASATGRYAFSIDAILLTPDSFTPSGRERPAPLVFQAPPARKKGR